MDRVRSDVITRENSHLVYTNKYFEELVSSIKNGSLRIAVYGLGHVGAPLAAAWLRAGASVIGTDKSDKVRDYARRGKTRIPEPCVSEAFARGLKEDRFLVYDDPVAASKDSFFKMICVPVMAEYANANLRAVENVASSIGTGLKRGDVVALTPSVPPGTTEGFVLPILVEKSQLECESDFFVVYNPERIYEGRAVHDIENGYPAIVAGTGPQSSKIASVVYKLIFRQGVIELSSPRTAEFEKLIEGVYRDVNIALANELAMISERLGVDFWEARRAANSQSYCHLHKPGIGVGGACIPIYPQFVIDIASKKGIDAHLTRYSRMLNSRMPEYAVSQALSACQSLQSERKEPKDYTVTLLGLAFRGGVSDTRLSPTYTVIEELLKKGIKNIRVHDPMVVSDSALQRYPSVSLNDNLAESLKDADLVIIVADHSEYARLNIAEVGNAVLYDGRGMIDTPMGIGKYMAFPMKVQKSSP
ncbi:MAG TPA: nucleotide sugar dehydrogenase [Nitrososphaeraceae archaeon]|nr:nucleotide sugar dehydrogenase [Nitrososphaeraceae archaeon]